MKAVPRCPNGVPRVVAAPPSGLNDTQIAATDSVIPAAMLAVIVSGVDPPAMSLLAPENRSSPNTFTPSKRSVSPDQVVVSVASEYAINAAAAHPPAAVFVLTFGSLPAAFVVASNVSASLRFQSAQKPANVLPAEPLVATTLNEVLAVPAAR